MKLLKVGERYINVDQVIEAVTNEEGNFWLVTTPRSNGTQGIALQGEENAAFKRWLEDNAEDTADKPRRKLGAAAFSTDSGNSEG